MPKNILLLGAGAVGAFYASLLSRAPNVLVSVICRSNFHAVKEHGFRISSPKYGSYTFAPAYVFPDPAAARAAGISWDYVVVATKALPDVSDDSALLSGLIGPGTAIVPLQNGIGVEAPFAHRFPSNAIISGVTIVSAARTSPGTIEHYRWTRVSLGPWLPHLDAGGSGSRASDADALKRCEGFVDLLRQGGVRDAHALGHREVQWVRWHKLAINAAMNPSAVLSGGSSNESMSCDPEVSLHLIGVMHEILTLASVVLGTPMPTSLASPKMVLRSTRRGSGGGRPSMVGDWEGGRNMELEVILGNAVRAARAWGVRVERVQGMYALLGLAQRNRDEKAKERARI